MCELLTVAEVASVLKCSDDAVVKGFAKLPGVIDLGKPETRSRRRYRVLRIPKAVVEKYLVDKSGHPVKITVPERPERRRRSAGWEDKSRNAPCKGDYPKRLRTHTLCRPPEY
jgi:hypothetical protein